ncbi:MAG: 16S rRNA (guanine(527)-N(7))-methyltransferase RsmG [Bacteroidales bacterium]|nr:16S rRNA (guanine(527)-N(7))-methyltransferase RsmG [Bacteroidales bacterium]
MEEILRYFTLTDRQREQFAALGDLYRDWNEKINVVSRKDIDNLYLHHVLHSLAIAKFLTPVEGTSFMDMGTGGGFPGIPLAIMWPDCEFHLIDRIGKKIKVASSVAESVGLTNVTFQHGDIAECKRKFDYVVSRAVMTLPELVKLVRRNVSRIHTSNSLPAGLLCLKGGDLRDELATVRQPMVDVPLSDYFTEEFFSTKSLIYVEL